MLEIERSELLQQVSVILQQCQIIVSRLSSSSPVPVCECQSSAPVQDHNDNYWWDGYTSQLSQFSNEFYSLLSLDYDDLFEDDDNEDAEITRPEVSMSSSIMSKSSSGFGDCSSTKLSKEGISSISSNRYTCCRKCECYNGAGCGHVTGEYRYPPDSSQRQEDKCHPVAEKICQDDPFRSKILQFLSTSCPNDVYNKSWREDRLKEALVAQEFFSLWINCHLLFQDVLEKDENINVAEFSPEIKYCSIDLQNVNARFIGNIPKPSYVPIQGVSQDPDLYHKLYPRNDYYQVQRYYKFNEPHPFGSAYGYETDVGIVPPPTDPVHGYVWKGGGWVLHAVMPGERSSSTKRRRG